MDARILTYKESADWDAYRAIGTLECKAAVDNTYHLDSDDLER